MGKNAQQEAKLKKFSLQAQSQKSAIDKILDRLPQPPEEEEEEERVSYGESRLHEPVPKHTPPPSH